MEPKASLGVDCEATKALRTRVCVFTERDARWGRPAAIEGRLADNEEEEGEEEQEEE